MDALDKHACIHTYTHWADKEELIATASSTTHPRKLRAIDVLLPQRLIERLLHLREVGIVGVGGQVLRVTKDVLPRMKW